MRRRRRPGAALIGAVLAIGAAVGVWMLAVLLADDLGDEGPRTPTEETRASSGGALKSASVPGVRTTTANRPSEAPAAGGGQRVGGRSPFAVGPLPPRYPIQIHFRKAPKSGVVFDVNSGSVLWGLNPKRQLPIASLTKMMTALLIVERHSRNEPVLITREALAYAGSGVGVLPRGKRIPLETMLNGLLLVSGNDAAIALAQHDAGTLTRFVSRMNREARLLGLGCSRFTRPDGYEDRGNHSCALDLAALARADLAQPRIARVTRRDHGRFRFPIKGHYLDLYNNNPFIREGLKGITGLKTGFTERAGRCYVTTEKRGRREIGVVLLNTPDPLRQVPKLLKAGFAAD